jgi:hypothetical protein
MLLSVRKFCLPTLYLITQELIISEQNMLQLHILFYMSFKLIWSPEEQHWLWNFRMGPEKNI